VREEENDNEDAGDEQGRQARRRRRDAVDVQDALRGRAVIVVVHGSPKAPIIGDDCDETDGAKTMATMERRMRR